MKRTLPNKFACQHFQETGHGPATSSTVNEKGGLADKLAQARGRINEHRQERIRADVIEGQLVETTK